MNEEVEQENTKHIPFTAPPNGWGLLPDCERVYCFPDQRTTYSQLCSLILSSNQWSPDHIFTMLKCTTYFNKFAAACICGALTCLCPPLGIKPLRVVFAPDTHEIRKKHQHANMLRYFFSVYSAAKQPSKCQNICIHQIGNKDSNDKTPWWQTNEEN